MGKAHLEGPTGIIALLNRFGFEFSFLHEDKMQNYTVPTIEDKGTRLLEKIDSTISYQLKHTFFSLIPNIRSVEIISNYLSFSIFPEHSKTLSEEIQILGNEFGPKIKLK